MARPCVSSDRRPPWRQALALGLVFILLKQLPVPLIPPDCSELVLSASSSTLGALLRKKLPPPHASILDALGTLFGRLCLQCELDVNAPTSAADERAVHALLTALAPSILRPSSQAAAQPGGHAAERAAAMRATRAILHYHAQVRSLWCGG